MGMGARIKPELTANLGERLVAGDISPLMTAEMNRDSAQHSSQGQALTELSNMLQELPGRPVSLEQKEKILTALDGVDELLRLAPGIRDRGELLGLYTQVKFAVRSDAPFDLLKDGDGGHRTGEINTNNALLLAGRLQGVIGDVAEAELKALMVGETRAWDSDGLRAGLGFRRLRGTSFPGPSR